MKRRLFLFGATAALAAPAIVRPESLMKLWVPPAPDFTSASLMQLMEDYGHVRQVFLDHYELVYAQVLNTARMHLQPVFITGDPA